MAVTLRVLLLGEAMAWFAAMPREQRVASLSPAFAHADLSRVPDFQCVHVGFEEGTGRWMHTVHVFQLSEGRRAAISPYGYGGPLCNTEDPNFVSRAWAEWQVWAGSRQVIGEFCRFHPEAAHHRFWLGDVHINRSTISVDLAVAPVDAQYNAQARRKARKNAGVPVRWSRNLADVPTFGAFYRAAMAALGASSKYHFCDSYFASMLSLSGAELCICGEEGAWRSAGFYLFQHREPGDEGRGGTLEYHLGASSSDGHAAGTAYLMQHAAALEGSRRGLANLYLGGGTTPDPHNPLLFYKRAFARREHVFHVGYAIHNDALYDLHLQSRGYHRGNAPVHILFN